MAEHKLELWILELWIFKDNTTSDFVLGFCHLKHKTAMMSFFRMNIYTLISSCTHKTEFEINHLMKKIDMTSLIHFGSLHDTIHSDDVKRFTLFYKC